MNKLTEKWTPELEEEVKTKLGKYAVTLEDMTDYQFNHTILGMLKLIHLSRQEMKDLETVMNSGNRIRVFNTTLIIFHKSLEKMAETQIQGLDQEEIEELGLTVKSTEELEKEDEMLRKESFIS